MLLGWFIVGGRNQPRRGRFEGGIKNLISEKLKRSGF
jgi:hypothetical protein